jgi:hypothetical protein
MEFYGKENAVKRGDAHLTGYPRYTGQDAAANDPFRLDLAASADLRGLYHEAEAETGYLRDENVFRPGIDIEDSLSLLIRYRAGARVTYSLNAFSPREGFRATITGDRGRLEYEERHASHLVTGGGETGAHFSCRLTRQRHFSPEEEVLITLNPGELRRPGFPLPFPGVSPGVRPRDI